MIINAFAMACNAWIAVKPSQLQGFRSLQAGADRLADADALDPRCVVARPLVARVHDHFTELQYR
ncbi:MAG: hypothetical protein ACTH1W_03195, partial [Advenella sp.]